MRYGTRSHARRRWTPKGHRPLCKVRIGYQWGYLFVALCPYTGDLFACMMPHLNKVCFEAFLKAFKEHLSEKAMEMPLLLIGDGAGAHQQELVENYGIKWQKLPTACPELNPVERFFEELRKYTANQVFESIQQIEILLQQLVTEYILNPEAIVKLSLYPYINTQS
jgi:transposase